MGAQVLSRKRGQKFALDHSDITTFENMAKRYYEVNKVMEECGVTTRHLKPVLMDRMGIHCFRKTLKDWHQSLIYDVKRWLQMYKIHTCSCRKLAAEHRKLHTSDIRKYGMYPTTTSPTTLTQESHLQTDRGVIPGSIGTKHTHQDTMDQYFDQYLAVDDGSTITTLQLLNSDTEYTP